MKNNLKENQIRSIEFACLCLFWIGALFIIIHHFSAPQKIDTLEILEDLEEKREILEKQAKIVRQMDQTFEKINTTEFGVNQNYALNDIKHEIKKIELNFSRNDGDSKFLFSKQAAAILLFMFDMRQDLNAQKRNLLRIKENLSECQAGIEQIK